MELPISILPVGEEDALPELSARVDFAAVHGCQGDGDIGEVALPVADDDIRHARHGGMHGVLSQMEAEDGIHAVGGGAADVVAGVKILDSALDVPLLEVVDDGILQEDTDIVVELVARLVQNGLGLLEELLSCALGHHNNSMVLLRKAFLQGGQEALFAIQGEGDLGNQAEIDKGVGKARVCRDEA